MRLHGREGSRQFINGNRYQMALGEALASERTRGSVSLQNSLRLDLHPASERIAWGDSAATHSRLQLAQLALLLQALASC